MTFTIGIPVWNGERYLREAIASALAQTRPADEVIVVDDASSDASAQIALEPCWSGRIRYIYNDNPSGFADAFNRIARLATSSYVVILSCDDVLDPDYLLHAESALRQHPSVRFCYSGYRNINKNGEEVGVSPEPHSLEPTFFRGKEYSSYYLQSVYTGRQIHRFLGVAIARDLLLNECPIRKQAGLIADNDLFVRVGAFTDVVGISQPLVRLRIHRDSVSNTVQSLSLRLAEDYLFLTCYHAANPMHLSPSDIEVYHKLAERFINELLLSSLLRGRFEWLQRAVNLRIELEKHAPLHRSDSSLLTRVLWVLALNPVAFSLLGFYTRSVRTLLNWAHRILRPRESNTTSTCN